MKKVSLVVAMCALLFTCLVGCGNKSGDSTSKDGKVELRISWWGGDSRNAAIQEAIKKFEEENENIKVKSEFSGYVGFQEKLTTQLSGGTAPDVVRIDSQWLDQYKNQLLDLNTLKDQIDFSQFDESVTKTATRDEKLIGLPLSTNYRALYYNKTILDEYGIEAPQSWEDLFAMRDKLPEDMYPLYNGFTPKLALNIFFYQIMAQQTGKSIGNTEGDLEYTKKDFQNALEFYKKLVDEKIMASKKDIDNAGIVDGAPIPGLANGKWLCFFEFSGGIANIKNQLLEQGFETAYAGFPSLDGEKSTGVWTKPAMYYSISKTSKHPEEAAKLMDFLLNNEEAAKIQKIENGVPDSKKQLAVLEEEGLIDPLVEQTIKEGNEKVDTSLSEMYLWEIPQTADMALDTLTALDYGEITVEEAADRYYEEFKELEVTMKER